MHRLPVTLWQKSLQRKIFLPFFFVLLLAGMVIVGVTSFDISTSQSKGVNDRLLAFQDAIYREVKKQEQLLVTYATLLEYMNTVDAGTAGILQDQLYVSLHDAKISVASYPAAVWEILPYPSLRAIIEQAQISGRPRFRLVTDHGSTPNLLVASPASLDSGRDDVIVLRIPFDHHFLRSLADSFKVVPHLLALDGTLLVSGEKDSLPPSLEQPELANVLAGKPLFKTVDSRRFLFQAIPLGTTDLVIAVAEAPMHEFGGFLQAQAMRSAFAFFFVLITSFFLYHRINKQITKPLEEILRAAEEVGGGNFSFRFEPLADNEMGQIGHAFNSMLAKVEGLNAETLARQKEISLAEAEEGHRELLERKNLEIALTSNQIKAQEREILLLLRLIQATNSLQDINLYLERIIELVQKTIACQSLALLLHHPGTEELEIRKVAGPDPELLRGLKFRVDSGFTGQAVKMQEMIYLNDLKMDNLRFHYRNGSFAGGSLVCAPMVTNERLSGLLLIQKKEAHAFSESELKLIQAVSWQLAIGLETARLYEWTQNQSTIDDLTGLANRRFFQEILKRELAQTQRYGSEFSLLMLDLDHFKGYTEAQGHLCGDSVLKQVSNLLRQNTRGIDLIGRFGTDRFSILLPKTDKTGALKAAEKLRLCIACNDFPGATESLPEGKLTVSIGISSYPADSRDFYDLIDLSDRALRSAKEAGRNCCHFASTPEKSARTIDSPVIS